MATTVLLFGYQSRDLARNWILEKGLGEHGYLVEECRTDKKGLIAKYRDLTRLYLRKWKGVDVILVTFMGYYFVPLAWVLAKLTGKILIFDALISLYESEVEDRRRLSRFDPRAWFLFFLDWFCYVLPDLVLLESPVYAPFLSRRYRVPVKRFLALPVSCRSDLFHPAETKITRSKLRVLYQGRFIPVHGVETIIDAAAILQNRGIEDIEFHFIGKGQTENTMRKRAEKLTLTNVLFRGFLPTLADVAEETRQSDIGLGMFQKSSKCDLCMPHKVYEVLASRVALISAKTTSSDAMFRGAKIGLFVPPGNPQALADAIVKLKNDPALQKEIAENGYEFFKKNFEPRSVTLPLVAFLSRTISRRK